MLWIKFPKNIIEIVKKCCYDIGKFLSNIFLYNEWRCIRGLGDYAPPPAIMLGIQTDRDALFFL